MYLKSQGIQDDDGFFGPNVKRHHLKGRAGTLKMFFLPKNTHGPWKSTTQDASWHESPLRKRMTEGLTMVT